uniref:Uncharacterized protein n=1 Tax=Aegilops tauschii subsp. strangulata TaxID=200361 RepID=A0A453S625_AEGTS
KYLLPLPHPAALLRAAAASAPPSSRPQPRLRRLHHLLLPCLSSSPPSPSVLNRRSRGRCRTARWWARASSVLPAAPSHRAPSCRRSPPHAATSVFFAAVEAQLGPGEPASGGASAPASSPWYPLFSNPLFQISLLLFLMCSLPDEQRGTNQDGSKLPTALLPWTSPSPATKDGTTLSSAQ